MKKEKITKFACILKDRIAGAEIGNNSVIVAYYLLLSLFPLLIVVGNLLALLNLDPLAALEYLAMVVPKAVMPLLIPLINSLLTSASGGLLSLGVLAALWTSSRGVGFLQQAMDKAYGVLGSGNFIVKRFFSLVTILLIILLLVAFALVFSLGDIVLQSLSPHFAWADGVMRILHEFKWPVTLGFMFALLSLVYRVTPDVKLRVRDALPGAAFASVGLVGLVQAFTLYLSFSARSFSSYGALSAFFVLMFWLNFSATIVILGAALNAAIAEYRFGKAQVLRSGLDKVVERTQNTLLDKLQRILSKKSVQCDVAEKEEEAETDFPEE